MIRCAAILSVGFLLFAFAPVAEGAQPANWKHQDVWLKNELGESITPTRNTLDPYSPKMTCGVCHSYSAVTAGYHFQQGFDQMSDRYDSKRPWALSPGRFGNVTAFGRLSKKVNSDPKQFDLSTYDWIGAGGAAQAAHGWTHPGGGPLEYGRGADGRADLSRNLVEAEKGARKALDGDFGSTLTPDRKSHFRESGVVEADCLICHMTGYRMDFRNQQLSARNYRWAATAGAGLGVVKGAVFTSRKPAAGPDDPEHLSGTWNFSRRPLVDYYWGNRGLFTLAGRLKGDVVRSNVASGSCLQCHRLTGAVQTGGVYAPQDDVHAKAGLQCTDCHGLAGKTAQDRLRHQIAKGWSAAGRVRDDLDGAGMKTCADCHIRGEYRPARGNLPKTAKNPAKAHEEKFKKGSFHFYFLNCNACHSTAQPLKGGYLLDVSAGSPAWYTADNLEMTPSSSDLAKKASAPWSPWMSRLEMKKGSGEQYVAAVSRVSQAFGERMENGEIRPISLRYVRQAFQSVRGIGTAKVKSVDGKPATRPTVATPEDVQKMIPALTRLGFKNVVFVADQVYEIKKGKVVSSPAPAGAAVYSVHHNVVAASSGKTLWAKGCADCHADEAAFFSKWKIRNVGKFLREDYPQPREPNAAPQMTEWGLRGVPAAE